MTNSIGEIRNADFLFVIGSNTTEAHPIIAMEMKRAVRRGATLVVADPRRIPLTQYATRHLQLHPGSDVWLLNSIANAILAEGLEDNEFIARHTEGFEEVRERVREYTPEAAEQVTGVPAELIRATAREYATTARAGIYYTLGITEHTHGTDNVYALSNLALMTGHLGHESTGLNPLRGQNNVQGANDSGASPIYYPGYQDVGDPVAKAKFETAWGVELSPDDGMNLNVMMKQIGGKIRGLFVMGEDILISEPDVMALERLMDGLDFVVVQDIFLNETCRFADVVLPAGCFAEKDGVFTNSERRVQRVRKAVEPPGEARADWRILVDLANACGAGWTYETPAEVYAEMAALSPKFAGISHARIEREGGLQWPCTSADEPGTPYLHRERLSRGKGLFKAVGYRPSAEAPSDDFPLILSTGRTLFHYNAATQTRRTEGLMMKQPEAFISIHPVDADARGVAHDDLVEVSSPRGAVSVRAHISDDVPEGCIWMPLHFPKARANLLTNPAGDSVTGTAEYKVCAAQVALMPRA